MQEAKKKKRCSRCSLPSNFRNIEFDKNGVCNFCRNHDKYIDKFRRFSLAEKNFLDQVEANRGKYQYDCAVGLSGGKDSTYVLYKLVKDYNLKVLAVTFDNSFLNDIARQYIDIVVNALHVDHVMLSFERDFHYKLYKEAAIQLGWPCIPCSFFAILLEQKYCFDHRIPFFVHGRARNQMLRELSKYSHDTYLPYYGLNYRPYKIEEHLQTIGIARKSFDKLMKILIKNDMEREEFKERYLVDPSELESQQFVPQFMAFFLMQDYDEPKIIDFMDKHVLRKGDKKLKEYHHYDCLAHDAFMYIYKQAFGWSLMELEIAFDVRDGKISREHAIEMIENEKVVQEISEESFELVCSKMDIKRDELLSGLTVARRNIKMYRHLMRFKNFCKTKPFKYI
jgi:hypothetical protein